ncbi:alkaline phosphatase family protein [Lichenihabitans psoromatis]|uniref:alkaline phosphatase family protein n=1 Tax=Lichenihabitans psoromatis TaxID=2528642 RepID=UPI0013F17E20|nr:alkaline phosphatase family protein [Lichenihabitans psoromatis]
MTLKAMTLALLAGIMVCGSVQAAQIEHVLLISVDGLHALDVARYVQDHPTSALAELASHGTTYSNASTPSLSDSFPGLLALVTGGSPVTHEFYYDVSYSRSVYSPSNVDCSGKAGSMLVFDESIDAYDADHISKNIIDPAALPRFRDGSGKCVALYPHSALKTNTIFEVVRQNGGHTAWADKHPAYDLVNGPSGNGVDDLYTPEITNFNGIDATASVDCTVLNDQEKVKAIINEIHGLRHDGTAGAGVPTVFGMDFQAVSVGQKLASDNKDGSCAHSGHTGQPGGYADGAGTPTDVLRYGLEQTDTALASMISELKQQKLYDSTLFIVSSKHGQSPINPVKVNKPGHFADLVAALPDAGSNAGAQALASAAKCDSGPCGFVQDDDVALIWLEDQSKSKVLAEYLNINAKALFIDQVLSGDNLQLTFNDPRIDGRTPDVIVRPTHGTIYTTSKTKNAEHGGLSFEDTNVALIVSNPGMTAAASKTPVATSQVAPTILKSLGISPEALMSVKIEHTPLLPGLSKD